MRIGKSFTLETGDLLYVDALVFVKQKLSSCLCILVCYHGLVLHGLHTVNASVFLIKVKVSQLVYIRQIEEMKMS